MLSSHGGISAGDPAWIGLSNGRSGTSKEKREKRKEERGNWKLEIGDWRLEIRRNFNSISIRQNVNQKETDDHALLLEEVARRAVVGRGP